MFKINCRSSEDVVYSKSQLKWDLIDADSPLHAVELYYWNRLKVWDADNAGDIERSFGVYNVETGEYTYFNLDYSWWCDYGSDEYIKDELEITEVTHDKLYFPVSRIVRDVMVV